MPVKTPPPFKTAGFVWSLGALLYLVSFFHRIVPAVLTQDLMRDFGITATALGNLSAFYFYSYMAMQIPTGLMADRLGPRKLLTGGGVLAAVGSVAFALAPDLYWACGARFLIGGAVAVAFVGLLKIANNWFPPRHFAMLSGASLLFGITGAVFAGAPLRLVVNHAGWRNVMLGAALATAAVGAAIWLFVRDTPAERGYANRVPTPSPGAQAEANSILDGIRTVLRYRNTLLLSVIPAAVVGSLLTFAGLWGVPFLTTYHGLTTARAAALTSALLVAWAVGGPFFGWLSDRLGLRKPLYLLGAAGVLGGWLTVVLAPRLPLLGLTAVLLLTGLSSGCMVLSFAFAKESVPSPLAGTVSGVVNMGIMLGPTVLQPAVGRVLDWKWQGQVLDGVRQYPIEAYQTGFSLMVVWSTLAFLLLFFTRETHCRPLGETAQAPRGA